MTDYLEQKFFETVPYGAKLADGLYRYLAEPALFRRSLTEILMETERRTNGRF